MGAFNTLHVRAVACPRCGHTQDWSIQFKHGLRWQLAYALGDRLDWGRLESSQREGWVRVRGGPEQPCGRCGVTPKARVYVLDDVLTEGVLLNPDDVEAEDERRAEVPWAEDPRSPLSIPSRKGQEYIERLMSGDADALAEFTRNVEMARSGRDARPLVDRNPLSGERTVGEWIALHRENRGPAQLAWDACGEALRDLDTDAMLRAGADRARLSGIVVQAERQIVAQGAAALLDVVPLLDSADDEDRSLACRLLEKLGPVAARALPSLTARLADPSPEIAAAAARAAGAIGAATPELLAALARPVADTEANHELRCCATLALGQLGAAAGPAVPALLVAIATRDAGLRRLAASALGQAGVRSAEVSAALTVATGDDVPFVRDAAREALERLERPRTA